MLEQFKMSIHDWEETFQKKFTNFCKKSPVLMKVQMKLEKGVKGVLITHVESGQKTFYQFDYDTDVKAFIAKIKRDLAESYYPRVVESVYEQHTKSKEELADELENGADVSDLSTVETRKVGERTYRIDKVLPWKDNAFLELEKTDIPGDVVGTAYRYAFGKSIVLFLRSYRTGKFKNIQEASDEFFGNSYLISVIDKKES